MWCVLLLVLILSGCSSESSQEKALDHDVVQWILIHSEKEDHIELDVKFKVNVHGYRLDIFTCNNSSVYTETRWGFFNPYGHSEVISVPEQYVMNHRFQLTYWLNKEKTQQGVKSFGLGGAGSAEFLSWDEVRGRVCK